MNSIDAQLSLVLPREPQVVDIETIRRQPNMTAAIALYLLVGRAA